MYAIEVGEYSDIVSWSKDGTSFVVKDPQSFTLRVVQVLFQMAKFDSFTRKLGRWGFAKKRDTEKKKVLFGGRLVALPTPTLFCHPSFQRGDFELCRTSVVCNSKVDIEACTLLLANAQKQWYDCHRDEERRKHVEQGANSNYRDNLVTSGIVSRRGGSAAVGTRTSSSSSADAGTAMGMDMNFADAKMSSAPASSQRVLEARGRHGTSSLQPSNHHRRSSSPSSITSSSSNAGAALTGSSNVQNVLDAMAAAGLGLPPSSDINMRVASLLSHDTSFVRTGASVLNRESGFDAPRNHSAGSTTVPRRAATAVLDRGLQRGQDAEGRHPAAQNTSALFRTNQEVAGSRPSTQLPSQQQQQQRNRQYLSASTLLEGFHPEVTGLQRQVQQQPFSYNDLYLMASQQQQQQQQYQQQLARLQEDRVISNDPNVMALVMRQQDQELQRLRDGINTYALDIPRAQSREQDGSVPLMGGLNNNYYPQETNQSSAATTRNHRQRQHEQMDDQLRFALMQNQANSQNGGHRFF